MTTRGRSRSRVRPRRVLDPPAVAVDKDRRTTRQPPQAKSHLVEDHDHIMTTPSKLIASTPPAAAMAVTPNSSSSDTSRSLSLYTQSSTPPSATAPAAMAAENKPTVPPATESQHPIIPNENDTLTEEALYLTLLKAAERPSAPNVMVVTVSETSLLDVSHDYSTLSLLATAPFDEELVSSTSGQKQQQRGLLKWSVSHDDKDDDEPFDIVAQEQLAQNLHKRLERNYSGSPNSQGVSLANGNSNRQHQQPLATTSPSASANVTILNLSPIHLQQHDALMQPSLQTTPSPLAYERLIAFCDRSREDEYNNGRGQSPAPSNTSSLSADDAPGGEYAAAPALDKQQQSSTPSTLVMDGPSLLSIYGLAYGDHNDNNDNGDDDDEEAHRLGIRSRNEGKSNSKPKSQSVSGQHQQQQPPPFKYYSRCIWIMFAIGALLLMTAIGMALGFVLTSRNDAQAESSNSTTSSSQDQQGNEKDSRLYPSPSPSRYVVVTSPSPWVSPRDEPHAPHMPLPNALPSPDVMTMVPTSSSFAEIRQQLIETLRPLSFDNGSSMEEPGSPQNQALLWLLSSASILMSLSETALIQRYAMACIYFSTSGPSDWINTDGWLTNEDECTWWVRDGRNGDVTNTCHNGGQITNLSLLGNSLQGSLPPEIGMLTALSLLDLSFNSLSGELPSEIGYLTDLEYILLHSNKLTGNIPESWASLSKLSLLRVDDNDMTGLLIRPAVCNAMFQDKPNLYADCGGSSTEVTCPSGTCCTYCCVDNSDGRTGQIGTDQNDSPGQGLFARGTCSCMYRGTALEGDLC